MEYLKFKIQIADKYQENLIAELFEMGFDGFEQRDEQIIAYIKKTTLGVNDRERIDVLLSAYPGNGFIKSEEVITDRNWNQQWEETIRSQTVGNFFIKPTWSNESVPADKILLEIDPKMSFGTGYHETTRLMLATLPQIISGKDVILDAGTGTGILSIAAIKLGAEHAFAFDIDEWSVSNASENIILNNVSDSVIVKKGGAECIPDDFKADVVLANIEKNVILKLFNDLDRSLKNNGWLVLSGLLEKDEEDIRSVLSDHYQVVDIIQENEWIAVQAQKATS